jgi:uncharacterized protein YndB with AHSA1/START domain
MSIKKEPSGRRSVQVEVEVPGTPEQVWEAIASGPGVSAWFVPTEIDPKVGGKIVSHFGPGMDAVATITEIDAPRKLVADCPDFAPGGPNVATEWHVEAKSGGTCLVRVVHSLFASTDDWDGQLSGTETGWPAFFRILRLYLTHFAGQPAAIVQAVGMSPVGPAATFDNLASSLGLSGAKVGDRRTAPAGVPALSGVLEAIREGSNPYALLFLEGPQQGAAVLTICAAGEQAYMGMSLYLYGPQAAATKAEIEPQWNTWLAERFPAAEPAPAGSTA